MNFRWCMDGIESSVVWSLEETSLTRPIKTVSTITPFGVHRRIKLAAGAAAPTLLWDPADNAYGFQFFACQIAYGDGYAYVSWIVDKAVSGTNLAPAGTHQRTNEIDLSCWTPFVLNTAYALVHATLATAAGVSAGKPAILTDAGKVQGRVYSIWAINQSSTTDIWIDVWVRN